MKQTLSQVLEFLKTKPLWVKILSILVIAMISTILISSCGTTRAVVTNRADGTTTTISISTSNPTSVDVSPDVHINTSTPNNN